MLIVDGAYTTLRAIERDEAWLQKWIAEKPQRLGLGDFVIKKAELVHYKNKGGRLDILGYRGDLDTYYEIEVMLGECDADHGFRTLDYWARERAKHPNSRHYAVLVAEDLSGRYKTIIETLPQFLPFIGIEIRVIRLQHDQDLATVETAIVAQPDDLIIEAGDEPGEAKDTAVQPRDREWWISHSSGAFIGTVDALSKYCIEQVGPSRIDYSAQSYVSLKKGRRCWLPMWPRATGAYVYLPGGDGGAEDAPSDFYNVVSEKLQRTGLEQPSWTYKYNAGANPIGFPVPLEKATHSIIREIIAQAYELA
jgi:hypothetical protein